MLLTADGGAPIEVTEDRLMVPIAGREHLRTAPAGTVLISAQGEGLIRTVEVVRVQGDRLVIETSPALLTDAVESGDASPVRLADGVATSPLTGAWRWGQDLGNLPGGNTFAVGSAGRLEVVSGRVDLRPSMELDLSIRRRRVQRFGMSVHGTAKADIKLKYTGRAGLQAKFREDLWKSPTKYMTWFIGYVPVVVTVRAKVSLVGTVQATGQADLAVAGGAAGGLDAGLAWRKGTGWGTSAAADFELLPVELTGDAQGAASVSASLVVKIETKLYGAAGPWLSPVSPFSRAVLEGAPVCEATLSAGVKGAAGVSVIDLPFLLPINDAVSMDLYSTAVAEERFATPWLIGCEPDPWDVTR